MIKKVKLTKMPVVSIRVPKERIEVPQSHMDALNRSISDKVSQNHQRQIQRLQQAKEFIVIDKNIQVNRGKVKQKTMI